MSIGTTLLDARLEAHLTLDDIATATRIRASLIRQIEADNFEGCGGAVYARGHIRSISTAIGIDPAPLVAEFNASQASTSALPASQILDHTEIVQRPRTSPNWTAAMLVVAVVLAAVAGVSLFTNPKGAARNGATPNAAGQVPGTAPVVVPPSRATTTLPSGAAPTGAAPPDAAPSDSGALQPSSPPASAPAQSTPQTPSSAPPVVAFNGVSVRVSATRARCWVLATDLSNAKKVLFAGVLERGTVRDFTATSKISMTFGDAGAVALTVNGRDLGAPGGSGKVVTVQFVPGDPGAG